MNNLINNTLLWRHIALWSYLGLMAWILLWNAIILPSTQYPTAIILFVLLVPLLFAVRGVLYARKYTHGWLSMLSLFYFVLGVGDAYADPADRIYGWVLIVLSVALFSGTVLFVRSQRSPKKPPQ